MDAKKALIITWVIIGLLVAGGVGFFLGRSDLGRGLNDLNNLQGSGQLPSGGGQQPGNNNQQPGQGGQQVITPSTK
jgi:hypothetical protein